MEEPKLATSIDNRTKPDQGQVGQRTSDVKLIARVNARPRLLGNFVKTIGIAIFGFTSTSGSAEGTMYKHITTEWTARESTQTEIAKIGRCLVSMLRRPP
jgi:hypothetical protein